MLSLPSKARLLFWECGFKILFKYLFNEMQQYHLTAEFLELCKMNNLVGALPVLSQVIDLIVMAEEIHKKTLKRDP